MNPRRLRAPTTDGGVLADPRLEDFRASLDTNVRRARGMDVSIQGRSLTALRSLARDELLKASRAYLESIGVPAPGNPERVHSGPLVLSGHQPELFHPGVWVKNFAASAMAKQASAAAVHIIVDNDVPKSASIRVPSLDEGVLRTATVEFDAIRPEVPFEAWAVNDCARFRSFPERVHARLGRLVSDPLIDRFWPLVRTHTSQTEHPRIAVGFSAARRQIEAEWGAHNWDVPLSALCQTDSFRWFFCHIIAQLERFHAVHNAALAAYRRANHIRSRNHPVPELATRGEWREAPFWGWRPNRARRAPIEVRKASRTIDLRLHGESEPFVTLPLSPTGEACCAVERLRELESQGIKIRTRALTTTLYSRVIVGDLFIHGIGGAKYDELGDAIIRAFYGVEPPDYLTLSMTLWLGLPEQPVDPNESAIIRRLERDLVYNPERLLGEQPPAAARILIDEKRAAVHANEATRRQRVARFRAIRRCNEDLAEFVAPLVQDARLRRDQLREAERWNAIAHGRDFSSVLYSEARLRRAFDTVVSTVKTEPSSTSEPARRKF